MIMKNKKIVIVGIVIFVVIFILSIFLILMPKIKLNGSKIVNINYPEKFFWTTFYLLFSLLNC